MPDATPQKCSLISVNDKAVLLNFEGAETTSNAGLMLLSKTEQKLGLSSSLASCLNLDSAVGTKQGLSSLLMLCR